MSGFSNFSEFFCLERQIALKGAMVQQLHNSMHSPVDLQPHSPRNKTFQNDQILKFSSSDNAYFAQVFIGYESLLVSAVILVLKLRSSAKHSF